MSKLLLIILFQPFTWDIERHLYTRNFSIKITHPFFFRKVSKDAHAYNRIKFSRCIINNKKHVRETWTFPRKAQRRNVIKSTPELSWTSLCHVHATVETIITRERGKKRPIERAPREGGRREKRIRREGEKEREHRGQRRLDKDGGGKGRKHGGNV